MARRKKSRKRVKGLPHPSVTGLASGLILAQALNAGYPATAIERGGEPHHKTDSVIGNLTAGEGSRALSRLSHNAKELVMATGGRKLLGQAIGIAVVGAAIKKSIGNPKLGFGPLFFRI